MKVFWEGYLNKALQLKGKQYSICNKTDYNVRTCKSVVSEYSSSDD